MSTHLFKLHSPHFHRHAVTFHFRAYGIYRKKWLFLHLCAIMEARMKLLYRSIRTRILCCTYSMPQACLVPPTCYPLHCVCWMLKLYLLCALSSLLNSGMLHTCNTLLFTCCMPGLVLLYTILHMLYAGTVSAVHCPLPAACWYCTCCTLHCNYYMLVLYLLYTAL